MLRFRTTVPLKDYGNDYVTELLFADGTRDYRGGQRPVQYSGVHGLVDMSDDEWHILSVDDGHFRTRFIVSEDDVRQLHKSMVKLLHDVDAGGRREISKDMSLTIEQRTNNTPLIELNIRNVKSRFDAGWLSCFIKVLDIDNPIEDKPW